MAELTDLIDKIKKYYAFTPTEMRGMAISIFVIAFVISFREWGVREFDFASGMFNLFNAILIVALSILVHDAGQRIWGLAIGYKIEFRMWTYGLLIALVLAFLSNGSIWLIVPGGFLVHHLAGHRLGWFRYGINYFGQAMVAFAGPLSTLMLIIFLRFLGAFSQSPLIHKAFVFNVIYLITSLLPFPPMDGSKMIFGSRMMYAWAVPALIIAAILLMIELNAFIALVLSMLAATILWMAYYISIERRIWKGP